MVNIFKTIKNKFKSHNKGLSLVISLIVMTLLLSISLSISSIMLRQIRLISVNNTSQHAFLAADSGLECALYYDALTDGSVDLSKNLSTAYFGTSTKTNVLENDIKCGMGITDLSKETETDSITNTEETTTIFSINFGTNMCSKVKIEKSLTRTKIYSSGYNTNFIPGTGCDLTDSLNRRIVERSLFISR